MSLRAYILDDEPLARDRIRTLARKEPDLEIVGEYENGHDALSHIEADQPNLIFLDVQMPGMDGFEFLKHLPAGFNPVIVFTTAHEEHALKAFDNHAADYLLKPFKPKRFKDAVEHARSRAGSRPADMDINKLLEMLAGHQAQLAANPSSPAHLTRLTIRDGDRMAVVRIEDIDFIESAGNYVAVHVGRESHILRETLNTLEAQLPSGRFLRISRSAIINLDHVKELQPKFKGRHVVLLRNGAHLEMTRGLKEVEQALKYT